MNRRILALLLAGVLAVAALAGCTTVTVPSVIGSNAQPTQIATYATGVPVTTTASSATAASVLAENSVPATTAGSAAVSADAVQLRMDGSTIAVESDSVTVEGNVATITAAGTYQLSGTLDDGQVVIDTDDSGTVYLILSGVSISSSTSAPIYVKEAAAVEVILTDGTENVLRDAATYVYASADANEPNAALFSDDPLVISGGGALTVEANFNDGITSKNGLTIAGGTISVTAADDGIRGKEYLIVEGGHITVQAGGDGLLSDNAADAAMGYVVLTGGVLKITAGGDGIVAVTDLVVTAGEVSVVAGGGSMATLAEDHSAKGLKAGLSLTVDGGSFTVDAAEDALHSDRDLTINGGTFSITAGDDGVHSDMTLTINGGEITISSYEGLESAAIILNAGTVSVVSRDDGVNAASGDGTASAAPGGFGGPQGGMSGENYMLTINGGTLVVDAQGDGLDANGTITMTDGLVIINGPTVQMNGALDVDRNFTMSGGTLVAVGSNGMAQAPDTSSSQNTLLLYFDQVQQAGTVIQITDSAGTPVLTFAPSKVFQSLAFSAPELLTGETYQISLGGSVAGTVTYGLAADGGSSGGTAYTSFTVESVVTQVGSGGRGRSR